ncbi:hypothetical protein CHH28_03265 [Bacterioplanes sanyensis]|uniref:Murein endopeptidase K n=1 Tax=Bacterioplanes sanyensis TaxID=1249553 RepID=A0A222FGK3_9GAMM|nr:DUF882 domain-containing protein [Bacterioplanes sanyensis]ASP37752.1 hypothetical protein CHH28_03265 [Bacterioplanes sanyensis]
MISRRQLLTNAARLSAVACSGAGFSLTAQSSEADRTLRLYNIHTGEHVTSTFWSNGHYIDSELQSLDLLVRDHRANQAIAMQRELYQRLFDLQQLFAAEQPMYIISGYRAPHTNRSLRQGSSGVAEGSLHMQGKAIDIRIPGVSHRHLHQAAIAMRAGGVGYYPNDGFVHLDTGRVRRWTS